MKKILIPLLLALMILVSAGCGANQTAEIQPTAEPTPEVTEDPHHIPMSGMLTDVLDQEQKDFISDIKSKPPVMAAIESDGEYPAAVVLDIDTVRELCTELTKLNIVAKTDVKAANADGSLSLYREDGENISIHFNDNNVVSGEDIYELEDADGFFKRLEEIAKDNSEQAKENAAAFESGEAYNASYTVETDSYLMRCVSAPAEKQESSGQDSQTVNVKLTLTNIGQHLVMSAKCIARYVDAEGRVLASTPIDLDFNEAPIYLGEAREYTLTQKLYNVTGADISGDAPLAVGVLLEVVSVNAPNEAGH